METEKTTEVESKFETYVINLDHSVERMEATRTELEKAGISDIKRFSAIVGRDLEYEDISEKVPLEVWKEANAPVRQNHRQHNLGSLGCYLSMTSAWKKFYDEGEKDFAVFMEDDIGLNPKFKKRVEDIIENNSKGSWDMIFMSVAAMKKDKKFTSKGNKFSVGPFVGAACILMKKSSIPKILKEMFPVNIQIDHRLSDLRGKLNIWVLENSPTYLRMEHSEIAHTPVVGNKPLLSEEPIKYHPIREIDAESAKRSKWPLVVIITSILAATSLGGFLVIKSFAKKGKKQ